jgi:NAD(P)-dependent dehydrogenase (short-subunit alcohol dehydrogenase family)
MRNVAVAALTKNLADELGPKGISAICVHPGFTRTESTQAWLRSSSQQQNIAEQEFERQMGQRSNVLQRITDAREVADVVTFLCSSKAIAINGDAVSVGSGWPKAIYY